MNSDQINQYFETIHSIKGTIERLERDYAYPSNQANPFYLIRSDFRDGFLKFRNTLIDSITSWYMHTHCPNISYDLREFRQVMTRAVGRKGFDARILTEYIEENYLAGKEELSYQHIIKGAASLLPISWDNGNKIYPTIEELTNGKTLRLSVSVVGDGKPSVNLQSCESIGALEKLVKIKFDGASPVDVKGEYLVHLYWETNSFYGEKEVNGSVPSVESVRAFKNGRFEVKFEQEENSVEIAEGLLRSRLK